LFLIGYKGLNKRAF